MNLYSQIGMILLIGLVCKNSILLVEYTNQLREKGLDTVAAVLEAGRIRLRPILMTSVATIMGAVPGRVGSGSRLGSPQTARIRDCRWRVLLDGPDAVRRARRVPRLPPLVAWLANLFRRLWRLVFRRGEHVPVEAD